MNEDSFSPEKIKALSEEREKNQNRWTKKSERQNRSFSRFVYGRKTPEDFMREEAERTDEDFEKRKLEEFKAWEGDAQPVIKNLKERRDGLETKEKQKRIMILILGGGMRGAYSMGQIIALNQMGITCDKVENVVCVSAGAGPGLYYFETPERAIEGGSVWYDECTDKEFLNMLRISHVMDSKHIGKAMRNGEKAFNQDRLSQSKTGLYVAVTRKDNEEAEVINVKTATSGGKLDPIAAIEATMNVPLLNAPGIEVDGSEYIDGAFDPLPIKKLIKEFNPTDILVLPNVPFDRLAAFKAKGIEKLAPYLPKSATLGTARKFLQSAENLRKTMEHFKKESGVNIAMLWPPDCGLTSTSTDPEETKMAIKESARAMIDAFGEKQPDRMDLYEPKRTE